MERELMLVKLNIGPDKRQEVAVQSLVYIYIYNNRQHALR